MSEKDNNVMPLATDPHNLGEFDNVYDAMRRYPNGGVDGDYIYILGVQHFWNVNRQSWGILKDKEDNLVQMVEDFIGLFERRGYVFAGYALPDTTPVSGLDNIFYIAAKNGIYTHFGSDLKLLNEVAILRKPRRSSIWIKDSMDIPNSERIDVIDDAISRINVDIETIKSAIIGMENDLDGVHDSIDDINKDIDAFKKETSENFEEVNSDLDKVEKRLDYIPKESFLSARPAGFKPDIDLTPEITVDRAWRDHEGNVIRDTYITRRGLRNEIIDITNQQVTDLKPGSVDPDDLSEATKQLIGNKSITNLPDEEDITVTDNQTLKLKDKEYAPRDYSGMGRVYLRKHYVNGVNTLTQHMMREPNTIYIIQYDYCLAGQTIEVPENCVLRFEGGSLRNGVLNGHNTCVSGKGITENLGLDGLFKDINVVNYKDITDISVVINNLLKVSNSIFIPNGTYTAANEITLIDYQSIKGESLNVIINVTAPNRFITVRGYYYRNTIENLQLIGTGTQDHIPGSGNYIPGLTNGSSDQTAIFFYNCHESKVKNVIIKWFMRAIEYGLNTWTSELNDIKISNCDQGVFMGNWVTETNLFKFVRVSIWMCGIGMQIYNGYLHYLDECHAELCNTGIKICGFGQTVLHSCYLERNHNRSIWFQDYNGKTFIQDCYFALGPSSTDWKDKPYKVNDIYFNNSSNCYVTLEKCWFNALNDILVNRSDFYLTNSNERHPLVVRDCVYVDNVGGRKLKLASYTNMWNLISKGDFKPLNAVEDNWMPITVNGDVLDLSDYPLCSQNFRITNVSNNTRNFIDLIMPTVSNPPTVDNIYGSLVYNFIFSNKLTDSIDYIKLKNVLGPDFQSMDYILLKGSENKGSIVKLIFVTSNTDGGQWVLLSEDYRIKNKMLPISLVPNASKMNEEELDIYKNHDIFISYTNNGLPSSIPVFFDGKRWRRYDGERAINPDTSLCKKIGNYSVAPRLDANDSPFVYYSTDLSQLIIWIGDRWVDANGRPPHRTVGFSNLRPDQLDDTYIGICFFDKSINKPIWWTGTNWVDATGATV